MSILSKILNEMSYMTNNVRARKHALIFAMLVLIFIGIISYVSNESLVVSNISLIFITIIIFFKTLGNWFFSKTSFFQDVPNELEYNIILALLNTLWNRVMIITSIYILLMIMKVYFDLDYMSYIAAFFGFFSIFYNTTLKESNEVFMHMRINLEE